MKREDIRIRDPFVLAKDGIYYIYSSTCSVSKKTVEVYRSRDLENWDEPTVVYNMAEDSWKSKELWAPEVHEYRGKFYLLVSILGKNGLRGTEISVSDTPDGIFEPITDRPATPLTQSCIDGTLFVDDGTPYIVYSHDWPDNYIAGKDVYVGEICAVKLSRDLKEQAGEPFVLFASDDVPYSAAAPSPTHYNGKRVMRYGSDAPFVRKLKNGKLFLTWCPFPNNNYVVLGATADDVRGPWTHIDKPLFDKNGGHAMFFTDFDGTVKMCIHQPEKLWEERARIIPVEETEIGFFPLEQN
ncbi:MAG: family 43 glycosylhydrolase [Clostridia bacterium]|nr:family 43 glycosylhydrolase [Clostridia bacterium]